MAKRVASSMPTQAESLKDPQVLNPTVRSYSLNEYEQKRPDYINPDHYAGSAWSNLGRSLEGFYASFRRYADDEHERFIERGISKGTMQASQIREHEGMAANRRNWQELVKDHPEYADLNPWVEVGYNQQRLKNLGSDMKTGLQAAMDESGIYNDTDPEAAEKFVSNYIAEFRRSNALDREDAILMAKNFSPLEASARESAMAKYSGERARIRQGKLADEVSVTIGRILEDSSLSVDQKVALISSESNSAFENGLLETHENRVKLSLSAVMGSFNRTRNRNVLEMIKKIDIGNGVKLIETPEGAQYYQNTWDHLRAQDAEAARKAESARRNAEEKRAKALGYQMYNALAEGKVASETEFFEKNGITTPSLRADVIGVFGTLSRHEDQYRKVIQSRPENIRAVEDDITDIVSTYDDPILGLKLMYEKTGNDLYRKEYLDLEKQEQAGMKADASARKKSRNDGYTAANDSLDNVMNTHIVIGQNDVGLKTVNRTKLAEVKRSIRPKMESDFTTLYSQKISMLKAKSGGKPLSDEDYRICQQEASIEVGRLAEHGKYLPKGFNANDYILDVYDDSAVSAIMALDRPMSPEQMVTAVPYLNDKFGVPEDLIRTLPVNELMARLNQKGIGIDIIMDAFGKAGLVTR